MVVGCQPYAPAAFTPRKYSWYSFLLEADSTPGPQCDQKDYVNEKSTDTSWDRTRDLPICSIAPYEDIGAYYKWSVLYIYIYIFLSFNLLISWQLPIWNFFCGGAAQRGPGPPHYQDFTLTLRETQTLGRTPEEWSVTTHNTHNRNPCRRRNSNPQCQENYFLDRASTGKGL